MPQMFCFLGTILAGLNCVVMGFGNEPVDRTNTVGFVEEDNQRDTLSLLISSFATLALCIYSAVYLSISTRGERTHRISFQELKWGVIGLFVPKLILYTAWRQFTAARQLQFGIRQATLNQVPGGVSDEKAFVPVPSIPQSKRFQVVPLLQDDTSSTSKKGVALLAHCGHVPEISVNDIKDKTYMYLTSRMSSEALASRTGKFRPANPQWRNFAYFEDVGSAEESHDATFPQDTARTGLVGRFRAPPHT
ncbi:hypothetical protein HBH53_060500 [Parastagonospora nodorum]|nr:hypothetical protein HBH53_060500 [Parastagonospora nodorum]KAH4811838.1 hypothetical protein HBH61_089010 [Parastagonospora nodorum]KAH4985781.1 hypothetical protein HBI76_119100 [Parastagonospora nodorum]KAH5103034.1 hypothetical protein HBH72_080100 [Parastagonospora nodorum]KAH5217366.1 hypothetical protein HBI62_163760 [Parastagonospora nodorum]